MSVRPKNQGGNSTTSDKEVLAKGIGEFESPIIVSTNTQKKCVGSSSRHGSNEGKGPSEASIIGDKSPSSMLNGTIPKQMRKAKSMEQCDLRNSSNATQSPSASGSMKHEAPRRRNIKHTDSLGSSTEEYVPSKFGSAKRENIRETKDNATERLPNIKTSKSEQHYDLGPAISKGIEIPSEESRYAKNGKKEVTDLTKGSGVARSNRYQHPKSLKSLKDVVESLKLKKKDISESAKKVNKVIEAILKSEITKSHPLFKTMKRMSSGSYYEVLKISKPNEFDIMLNISFESYQTIEMTSIDESGAFYTLAFKRRKPAAMASFIDDGGNILAKHILDYFRTHVKEVIKSDLLIGTDVTTHIPPYLQKKEASSPAVTLLIPHEPEPISVDLVLALEMRRWPEKAIAKHTQQHRKEPCYMVPKNPSISKKDTWRVSFSNIEKKIMHNHGSKRVCCKRDGTKCCRKPCLKLMKHLLELLKMNGNPKKMNKFCSYHAKTTLLHLLTEYPEDEDWALNNLEHCFERLIEHFQTCLSSRCLPNFFVPTHNLFSSDFICESSCDYLWKAIEYQKSNKYPIFYEERDGLNTNLYTLPCLPLFDGGA